jgi:hypothetical protein
VATEPFLKQLERESVIKKADILHQVTKGQHLLPFGGDYQYSRDTLKHLDRQRHEAVHQLKFGSGFPAIEQGNPYLFQTVSYFAALLNGRYGVQIDLSVRDRQN